MSQNTRSRALSIEWIPVASQSEIRQIFNQLIKAFPAVEESRLSGPVQSFDTFDWKILATDQLLLRTGGEFGLIQIATGEFEARTPVSPRLRPRFWSDLPEGETRTELRKITGKRALLPAGRFRLRYSRISIRDDNDTIVCRLDLIGTGVTAKGQPVQEFCGIRILPVKGEGKAAKKVKKFLAANDLFPDERTGHPLLSAMEASERKPLDYTSKIVLRLDSNMTAGEAAREIHLASIATAERNIPGILQDLDVEFLHDFRVALRRNRSALSLIKDVFPPETTTAFKDSLGAVQKKTNRLRDLDVYLMEEERFRRLLPPELHPGLDTFFLRMRTEREEALAECRAFFQTETPRKTLAAWRQFLTSPPSPSPEEATSAPTADLPVRNVARKLLAKRFRRILRDGRKIDSSTPDARVHELRIQFKKLRYLMEFFGTLFPKKKVSFLVDRCRKLQDTLGRLNDFAVQEEWVAERRKADKETPDPSMETSASLGALLTELRRAQRKERKKFARAFRKIDHPKVEKTIEEIF